MVANSRLEIFCSGKYDLVEGDTLKIVKNGIDQDSYVVPVGKLARVFVVFDGGEVAA